MAQYKFLRVSVKIFKVLAWLSLVIQVVTGVILLVVGGDPVLIGGVNVPARVVGVLNFIVAVVYFFSLWLMASLIRLWLDIRERLAGGQ